MPLWKTIRLVLLVCFMWQPVSALFAQPEFSIAMLDVRKGLLSNFVTRTISDDKQFKYFATEAGISRYDGYHFRHYRPSPGSKGLVSENIETIYPSKDGYIWIGTKTGGLSRLDVHKQVIDNLNDVFSKFAKRPLRIVSLAEDPAGNLWVGTWGMGCFKLNIKTRQVAEHFPSTRPIYSMICDSRGTVWFSDGKMLCAYKNGEGTLQRNPLSFYPYSICEDTARQRIWAAGNLDAKVHLAYYDQVQATFTEQPMDLKARFMASLAIDRQNRLWMGSWGNGLFISNTAATEFQPVNTTDFGNTSSNSNHKSITNIYIDKNGIAWLSTSYGGVLILYPNKGFRNIANNQPATERDYNVTTMASGQGKQLLAGTISQGLFNVGDPNNAAFSQVTQVPRARINQVYQYGAAWLVATNDGLLHFPNGLNGPSRRYFPLDKITAILITPEATLWLGTQQRGLMKMPFASNLDTSKIENYSEQVPPPYQVGNNRINKIIRDDAGRVWLATHSGLNLWDEQKKQFVLHQTLFGDELPGIIVHDLLVNGKDLFLASPNGLFRVGLGNGNTLKAPLQLLAQYNENHGLVNQFVCALQQDRNGNIWFSSTTSISKLNTHTDELHHFGKEDGVQINAFHISSSLNDSLGNLYFGGDNGLVWFNPEAVIANYQQPKLVLTGLSVNNQLVEVGQDSSADKPLSQAIQYTNSISLDHAHNHVVVQFAANDFLGTENISYAYKLMPRDKEWMPLRDKNEVSFTGLQPGDYTLAIRANRNNQGWGEPTMLDLHIAYPPWLRWYAWLFYILVGAVVIIAIRKMRLRQQNLKLMLQKVQLEKEKEHEINEAKINFFTNISHEFRTPLTLIMSPSSELLGREDLPAADRQKISFIRSNAQKLLRLINQLLDFRKSEHGLLQLRTHPEDMRKIVGDLLADFAPVARAKNIKLSLESDLDELLMDIDRSQMEMAINNLISNAIKFTPENGKVWVRLSTDGDKAALVVGDTGVGIAPVHLDKIFNRFYQVPGDGIQQTGSGIGLAFARNIVELHNGSLEVDSTVGKGTEFTISLPLHQAGKMAAIGDDDVIGNWDEDESAAIALPAGLHSDTRSSLLIIDDNEDIRTYLAGLLKEEYVVLEADNGASGHQAALEHMPDLIISDIMMPRMSGTELCSELKHNMATSHIPIILLTAKASEVNELRGLQTGADDYITKPFNPQIVQLRVRNMLENRRKLKDWYQRKVRFEPETEGEAAENLDEVFLKKAIDLVNENLQSEELGIEMMVDHLFMSQSTLYRKIKSLTGLSLTGFIRALRTKKAAQLILQTNMKMNDVAFEVGFNDYKYFKKSFQQQFGCLPSEYREKHAGDLHSNPHVD